MLLTFDVTYGGSSWRLAFVSLSPAGSPKVGHGANLIFLRTMRPTLCRQQFGTPWALFQCLYFEPIHKRMEQNILCVHFLLAVEKPNGHHQLPITNNSSWYRDAFGEENCIIRAVLQHSHFVLHVAQSFMIFPIFPERSSIHNPTWHVWWCIPKMNCSHARLPWHYPGSAHKACQRSTARKFQAK